MSPSLCVSFHFCLRWVPRTKIEFLTQKIRTKIKSGVRVRWQDLVDPHLPHPPITERPRQTLVNTSLWRMVHAWVSERTLRVLLSSCSMELNMVSIMLFDRSSQVDRVRSFRRDQDGWGREGEAGFIKNLLCGQILSACNDAFRLFQAFLFLLFFFENVLSCFCFCFSIIKPDKLRIWRVV